MARRLGVGGSASAWALLGTCGLWVSAAQGDEDPRKLLDAQPAVLHGGYIGGLWGAGPDQGFEAENVEMLSWVPLNMFSGAHNRGNDCWGYVSASGREYAIMGLEKGFGFVEITDPRNPVIVGVVTGPSSTWHDIKVINDYAYGVSEGGSGIQVVDLRQIDAGVVRHVGNITNGGHTTTHNIAHNPDTGFLYLCGSNAAPNRGLVAVSTTSPEAPTIVGAWSPMYVHDAQIVSYTSGPLAGREIAFCASGTGNGSGNTALRVIDVTNKANMVQIGEGFWPQPGYSHQCWLSEDRRYLYVDDELDEQNFGFTTRAHVFNVEDPTDPVYVGSYTNGNSAIDHNMYVKGDRIFAANYRSGLRVFDAANPAAPVEIGYFDTYPGSNSAQFNGAWSCYPYFPSGNIIISDIERGLFVVELNTAIVTLEPVGTYPSTVPPDTATPVEVDATPNGGAVLAQDGVKLHVRVDGGAEQQFVMADRGNNRYGAEIPGAPCFAAIDFWFSATTDENRTYTLPGNAPTTVYNTTVLTGSTVFANDDFEISSGWTGGLPGDTATTGAWGRMDPEPTNNGGQQVQPADDHTPVPGVNCWVTDGRAGTSVGQYDVDNGFTTLLSPVYDLAGQPDAVVSYWRWYSNGTSGTPTDTFRVDVTNNGASWVNAETVGPTGPGTTGGWIQHSFNLAAFVTPTANVRVRFIAEDIGGGSIVEAAIDDLRIETVVCEGCYADCDHSTGPGVLDIFDFLCFQNRYAAHDPYACDCDASTGPEVCDIFDFLCFQNAFAGGCP